MGKRIDGLDEKIIASAKAEFLREGYLGASLRQIAQGAGVSTASILTMKAIFRRLSQNW